MGRMRALGDGPRKPPEQQQQNQGILGGSGWGLGEAQGSMMSAGGGGDQMAVWAGETNVRSAQGQHLGPRRLRGWHRTRGRRGGDAGERGPVRTGEGAARDQPQKEGGNQRKSPCKPRGVRVSRTVVRAAEATHSSTIWLPKEALN